jgi:hypothetical protein
MLQNTFRENWLIGLKVKGKHTKQHILLFLKGGKQATNKLLAVPA